tara:strand:+ start:618 stop:935 length:318 start_codon:yes stop_codon:yes gene_type:complete
LKINIFSLIFFILLSFNFKVFANISKVELSNTNDLKCTYNIELNHTILNSKIDCRNFVNRKNFIKGWDKNNCKSKNYTFKKENLTYQKVAIYCLSLDEKKYLQVY